MRNALPPEEVVVAPAPGASGGGRIAAGATTLQLSNVGKITAIRRNQ